jgi:hypothetical protein
VLSVANAGVGFIACCSWLGCCPAAVVASDINAPHRRRSAYCNNAQ